MLNHDGQNGWEQNKENKGNDAWTGCLTNARHQAANECDNTEWDSPGINVANKVSSQKVNKKPLNRLKTHLRDPCGLCIVLRFEISYFPPRCVAHEEEKQQPYSEAGEMEQYQIFLPIKMNN